MKGINHRLTILLRTSSSSIAASSSLVSFPAEAFDSMSAKKRWIITLVINTKRHIHTLSAQFSSRATERRRGRNPYYCFLVHDTVDRDVFVRKHQRSSAREQPGSSENRYKYSNAGKGDHL